MIYIKKKRSKGKELQSIQPGKNFNNLPIWKSALTVTVVNF